MILSWFKDNSFPLYLAPMAGVTDSVFRTLCKPLGADVMVTEFVSAEGILQNDKRTSIYTQFDDLQRPIGIQLFGSNGEKMGEASKKIIDTKKPDFIDINFGCPVKKVVSKNGGSSLLKNCRLVEKIAKSIVKIVGDYVPVTAKIRIGWDENTINAKEVCKILEDNGISAIAIHGRTRSQNYSGVANWDIINECSQISKIPIIGNGDIKSPEDVSYFLKNTNVSGIMIGRIAMQYPWIFNEIKSFLKTGKIQPKVSTNTKWSFILKHAKMLIESKKFDNELLTIKFFRSRLMAYSKSLPNGKHMRMKFSTIKSFSELEEIAYS